MLQPGGRGGWGRELKEVMTVTGTIAEKDFFEEVLEDARDIPATISDTADKASKTVSTGRAGTNNISDTGEEC